MQENEDIEVKPRRSRRSPEQIAVRGFGGNPAEVPEWPGGDYDSLYVLRISDAGGKKSVSFSHDHEGLTDLSPDCH